jgi:hypothetical protein
VYTHNAAKLSHIAVRRLHKIIDSLYLILKLITVTCTVHSIHTQTVCLLFAFLALQPIGLYFPQPPRFRGFLITHNDAPQSVGLLWTSDQSVAEIST